MRSRKSCTSSTATSSPRTRSSPTWAAPSRWRRSRRAPARAEAQMKILALVVMATLGTGVAHADQPAADAASVDPLDKNHTGKLEGEEAKVVETVGETPDAVDSNEDGRVDRNEFEAVVAGTTGTEVRIEKPKDEPQAEPAEAAEEEELAE